MPGVVGQLRVDSPHPLRTDPDEVVAQQFRHGQVNPVVFHEPRQFGARLHELPVPEPFLFADFAAELLRARRGGLPDQRFNFLLREGPANDQETEGMEMFDLAAGQHGALRFFSGMTGPDHAATILLRDSNALPRSDSFPYSASVISIVDVRNHGLE